MNSVNLPIAVLTVFLRRFIDKLRTPQGAIVLKSAPWLVDTSLFKPCMYAYMFTAGLYYTIKGMQRGTIVSLAQKCSSGALSIKDKCLRKKWVDGKKSWLVKNLSKNRDGQQKALRYVASLDQHDRSMQAGVVPKSSLNSNRFSNNSMRDTSRSGAYFNNQPECSFGSNPYFEPKGSISKVPYSQSHSSRMLNAPTILDSKCSTKKPMLGNRFNYRQRQSETLSGLGDTFRNYGSYDKRLMPVTEHPSDITNISDKSITDDTSKKLNTPPKKRKPAQRLRNCLTLRGRKINKTELNCDNKIVRKTRSGRIYGYQSGRLRYKKPKTFKM